MTPSFFRPSSILDLIMGINVAVNKFLRMNIVCEIQHQQSIWHILEPKSYNHIILWILNYTTDTKYNYNTKIFFRFSCLFILSIIKTGFCVENKRQWAGFRCKRPQNLPPGIWAHVKGILSLCYLCNYLLCCLI